MEAENNEAEKNNAATDSSQDSVNSQEYIAKIEATIRMLEANEDYVYAPTVRALWEQTQQQAKDLADTKAENERLKKDIAELKAQKGKETDSSSQQQEQK